MTLRGVIEKHFGVKTSIRVNPITPTVATTATQLLRPNPNRLAWTLINLSAAAIYVGFTQDVGTSKGVYVSATGGVFGLLFSEDFVLCAYPIWAIVEADTATVYLVEVLAR